MSLMVKIVLAFLLLSISSHASLDYQMRLSLKKDTNISSESFNTELEEQRSLLSNISSEREKVKLAVYGTRKFKDFVFATPVLSEAAGWVNVGFDVAFDGVDWLANSLYDIKIEQAVKGSLYKAWMKDKKKLQQAFSIRNHSKKTKAVMSILENLDDFGRYLGSNNLSTDQRSALNSRLIIKLAGITKNIGVNTLNNSAEIDKLKLALRDYEIFKKENLDNLKLYLEMRVLQDDMSEEIHRRAGNAARNIASIIEGKDFQEIRSDQVSQEDKKTLKESMAEVAETMDKAEVYLNKISVITNNIFRGEGAQKINKGLFYASNGVKIIGGAARAYSGDYMGAMDALVGLSNLIGKGKPSPEQQRHQQVMEAFNRVFKNQRMILENQKRMYELQLKTYKLVAKVYNLTRENFLNLNERIDTVIGNQAAILGNVVEFSDVKENLNYCKDFLNTRFKCRPEFLESNGDILKCVSQIKKQKPIGSFQDGFIPYKRPKSTVMIQGYFSTYEQMKEHFNEGQNKLNFKRCYKGLTTILQHDLHPLFESRTYPVAGSYTTYNDRFIEPVYKPLMTIAEKYFMRNEKSANAFYKALLIPHETVDALSLKAQRMNYLFRDRDDYELLTYDQVRDGLYRYIYMPALDHFMSSFTEMSSYWDLIGGNIDGHFYLYGTPKLIGFIEREGSSELKRYYRKLVKIVELAIAQQNLVSGDVLLPIIRRIVRKGFVHPDFGIVAKAIKNNYYLAHNFFIYTLVAEFEAKANPEEFYDSYLTYKRRGIKNCFWNEKQKNYGRSCQLKFLRETNLPFIFSQDGIYLKGSKETQFTQVSSKSLREKKVLYSPHFYRTLKLKQQLYSRMSEFNGVLNAVTSDNLYTLQ